MEYLDLIDKYRDEMLVSLQELVAIPSVQAEAVTDAEAGRLPFGRDVHEAFVYMLKKAEADGFITKNVENYGGHIEWQAAEPPQAEAAAESEAQGKKSGTGKAEAPLPEPVTPEIMAIAAHVDVVPAGSGWKSDAPFAARIEDGKMYGRGVLDDKGPLISVYYAMKALKESGFEPRKTIRLILGLDEENAWEGMKKYLEHEEMPDFGFTPDADFPLINGEKGIADFRIARKFGKAAAGGLELRSMKGGSAHNMVADYARAVVRSDKKDAYDEIKEKAAAYREATGRKLNVKGAGKSLEISTTGVSAHGAEPEKGLNAISILFDFLGQLAFASDDVNDFIAFYNEYIGFETTGEKMGCGLSDEQSGALSFNVGLAGMDPGAGEIAVNVRIPVTFESFDVYDGMKPVLEKFNLGLVKEKYKAPIYQDPDSPMVRTMMAAYREITGDAESKPRVIGGGTYSKLFKNMVAYGAVLPGHSDNMHQANEVVDIEDIFTTAKIYARAIVGLCG